MPVRSKVGDVPVQGIGTRYFEEFPDIPAVALLKIGILFANAFKGLAQETSRTAPKPAT